MEETWPYVLLVSCTRSDSLAGGASYPVITVNVNVSQSAPATITNMAVVAGGSDISPLNDTASDAASTASSADLAVTDSDSPDPVAAGSNITYTQVVTNSGPSAADNAVYTTTVPTNTTFISISAPAGWSCQTPGAGNIGNVVCKNTNMAGSTSGTFTMIVKVNTASQTAPSSPTQLRSRHQRLIRIPRTIALRPQRSLERVVRIFQ